MFSLSCSYILYWIISQKHLLLYSCLWFYLHFRFVKILIRECWYSCCSSCQFCVMVVLASMSDGNRQNRTVIFKTKTVSKDHFCSGVIVHKQSEGWLDGDKMGSKLSVLPRLIFKLGCFPVKLTDILTSSYIWEGLNHN